jgi:hypothetical protein
MVYGIAVYRYIIPVYRYIGILRYTGRDENQFLGPRAGQAYDLGPEMHMHISFPLYGSYDTQRCALNKFSAALRGFELSKRHPDFNAFPKSNKCLFGCEIGNIHQNSSGSVFVRSGCIYVLAAVPPYKVVRSIRYMRYDRLKYTASRYTRVYRVKADIPHSRNTPVYTPLYRIGAL